MKTITKFLMMVAIMLSMTINSQEGDNVSHILQDMEGSLGIGNGCGQMFEEQSGYAICYTEGIELNGNILQVMWMELTVYGNITDYGEVVNVQDLIDDDILLLHCPESTNYEFSSTIIVLDETLSTTNVDRTVVKVYPNPATDVIYISGTDIKNIVCYDANGKLVFKVNRPVEVNEINLINYKSGAYFIGITNNSGTTEVKQIIIK